MRKEYKLLIYTGIKVKLKNENCIYGSLLNFYQERGYVYVNHIFENGNVFLSDSPHGCLSISASSDVLIPIYDGNILNILNKKKEEFYNLDKEIKDIEKFINEKFKEKDKMIGKVKWFDTQKGYGFIVNENREDVFVHYSGIKSNKKFKFLNEDDVVTYDIEVVEKGVKAINVQKVSSNDRHLYDTDNEVIEEDLWGGEDDF